MRQSKLLKNNATFTATLDSTKIVAQNIKRLKVGFRFLGTGTTASVLANVIGVMNEIKLTVGGEIETLVKASDLFALNFTNLYRQLIGEIPSYLMSTTVDNTSGYLNIGLPVMQTTDLDSYVDVSYGTVPTDTDTGTISISADFGNKPYPAKPTSIKYITGTATTTGQELDLSVKGRRLIGLLAFATTIPAGASAYACTIDEVKLLVKRSEVLQVKWDTMDRVNFSAETPLVLAVLNNYRWIDLSDDPVSSDDLKVWTKSATSTDALRFIGVYQ